MPSCHRDPRESRGTGWWRWGFAVVLRAVEQLECTIPILQPLLDFAIRGLYIRSWWDAYQDHARRIWQGGRVILNEGPSLRRLPPHRWHTVSLLIQDEWIDKHHSWLTELTVVCDLRKGLTRGTPMQIPYLLWIRSIRVYIAVIGNPRGWTISVFDNSETLSNSECQNLWRLLALHFVGFESCEYLFCPVNKMFLVVVH